MHGAHRASHHAPVVLAVLAALALVLARGAAPAHAEERVPVLTRMLASSSDKTRLSAVLALAKLGTPAAQQPLIKALRDRNVRVRAVAATALGSLACEPALPTLRTLATDDADPDVRKAAGNAAMKIALARRAPPADRDRADADALARRASGRTDPRDAPEVRGTRDARAAPDAGPHPELYVLVNSSSDDSPGTTDRATRKMHAELIKRVLIEQCRTETSVTSIARDADRWGLAARHIDLSVTRLQVARVGGQISIDAQLRLAISDDHGKMLSFLTGGARLEVPSQKFDARQLPGMRREVLENAMRGMFQKLLAHLRDG